MIASPLFKESVALIAIAIDSAGFNADRKSEESLVRWARDRLCRIDEARVPRLIRQLQIEVTIPEEVQVQIMKDYLDEGETAGEYVKR
jgi:hypothetical protein